MQIKLKEICKESDIEYKNYAITQGYYPASVSSFYKFIEDLIEMINKNEKILIVSKDGNARVCLFTACLWIS